MIKNATIHEIGHAIDFIKGNIPSSEEWINIYSSEKDSFIEKNKQNNNSTINAIEYFAEIFNQSMLYADNCNSTAPLSYQFIINLINDF